MQSEVDLRGRYCDPSGPVPMVAGVPVRVLYTPTAMMQSIWATVTAVDVVGEVALVRETGAGDGWAEFEVDHDAAVQFIVAPFVMEGEA